MPTPDVAAIVWAPHEARTAAFASWLGARLHNVHYLKAKRPWLAPIKYVLQWVRTWWILFRDRPRRVFVTNSPPVAGLCVQAYCLLTGARFVLDVHPPSLFNRKWAWSRPVQRFTARRAALVLVDQARFAELFESWGATALVLTNPPRTVDTSRLPARDPDAPATFTYVGTFGDDEPVDVLLDAMRRLPDARLAVLGDDALAPRVWVRDAPANVTFTGYLVGDAYWARLHHATGVVVLTTHAHSLLGGAQDGMRVGRPLILSDQPTLREHFPKGAVFATHDGEAMARAMARVAQEEASLARDVVALRDEADARWQRDFGRLQAVMRGEDAVVRA